MVQIYADGTLIYDTRTARHELLGLSCTSALNKGGTATIQLPPDHPIYSSFVSYRTLVEIYRDGVLRFRGRALYPSDDFQLCRTITCEGERCFFRDAPSRPKVYTGTAAAVFSDIIEAYNAEVEAFKQFLPGTVTIPDTEVSFEVAEAEKFSDTIDKLVERLGGYLVFTTNANGRRVVNWYERLDYRSSQVIALGENLLDFNRTTANSQLATVIIPYGAQNSSTKTRVDITSVNGGLDFIQDTEAVQLRGRICEIVVFDDITSPAALLTKAQQYLANSKNLVATLSLTAIDLSLIDKTVDSFQVGDNITVRSTPHGEDDTLYQLTEQTLDFLHPENDRIQLGKSVASLTGADVASNRRGTKELQRIEQTIKTDTSVNMSAALAETQQQMTTLIQQTTDSLKQEVSEQYVTSGELDSAISTTMLQLSDSFEFLFSELKSTVDANDSEARQQFATIDKYIRFEDGNIILGEAENEITLRIENDRISFLDAGAEVAYFSNKRLTVLDGHFLNSLRVGSFAFLPRENGNLSLVKVGG